VITNAITRVEIKDFLAFKGEFTLDFCNGVNVLIGVNGSGKTTLMKVIYAACDLAKNRHKLTSADAEKTLEKISPRKIYMGVSIEAYFPYLSNASGTISGFMDDKGTVKDKSEPIDLCFSGADSTKSFTVFGIDDSRSFVFIPTDDMLSHSKGFLALNNEREMPFDRIFVDILSKAELPITREITPNATRILDRIKSIIGGEVLYENDIFFVVKEGGEKTPFSLEASGFRKFGLLWKLLRNGLLENGSILFWDEPEASINPELIPVLVDILLELQKDGVQIFVATHSYDVVRWFELNETVENSLRYFNLRKSKNSIVADVADDYVSLPNSVIEDAGDMLLKRVTEVAAINAGIKLR
jgi:AAA15 family ATPase/GTPase